MSSIPRRTVTEASPDSPHVREPAGRSGQQRLVAQRVLEPARRHALDAVPDREEADQVADPTGKRADDRGAGGTRRPQERDARPGIEEHRRSPRQGRVGEQPDVGQGVVDPAAAERPEDDDLVGASLEGGQHRELGVGLVLGRRDLADLRSVGREPLEVRRRDRVAVTDPDRRPKAERRRRAARHRPRR